MRAYFAHIIQREILRKGEQNIEEKWGKLIEMWGQFWGKVTKVMRKVRKVKGKQLRDKRMFWENMRKGMGKSEESYEEKWGKLKGQKLKGTEILFEEKWGKTWG